MDHNPYQVLGTHIARRLGREREWQRILSQVERNHLSVIGPKHIGKTVLLHSLAEHFQSRGGAFRSSLYWDLRHGTPEDDEQFYAQFAVRLATTVRPIYAEYAIELEKPSGSAYKRIQTVLELLRDEGIALLLCLDGWDHLLLGSAVTRNLLDNLRSLAEWPTVRLVTGSRRRLRELCASREARTSDFHNIFGNPFTLASFQESDIDSFIGPFTERGVTFGVGSKKELLNWTGGIPVLLACLCRDVWGSVSEAGTVTKDAVDQLGARLHLEQEDTVRELWDDCTEEERALVSRLHGGQLSGTQSLDRRMVSSLVERGLLRIDGKRLQVGCGALRGFLDQGAGGLANVLATLFAGPEAFAANARGFLQLRFAALPALDSEVASYLQNMIETVDTPKLPIRMVRALMERCFELIWDRSIPDRDIPPHWTEAWKQPDRDGEGLRKTLEGKVPGRLSLQCRLLDLMTDPRKVRRTMVRRSTYALLNGLQSVGDFGQHLEGETVPHGFGVAVCLSALQMAEQLQADLNE